MKRVRYLDEARVEFLHELAYYAAVSRPLARRFDEMVQQAEDLAREFPAAGSPSFGGARKMRVRAFPFSLVYAEAGNEIIVLAMAHHSRRPGYWHSRIGKDRSSRQTHG